MSVVTCVECQDLLLDLAYGELDPVRAAEVEAHVAGCESCARERRQIASTRMLFAPLLRREDPSAAMDETILKAARDEATRLGAAAAAAQPRQSAAAGPRVVEVAGSIGMPEAAAPFDVRAPVRVAPAAKAARPRWALRFALGGSVAAAAALVLVATNLTRPLEAPGGAQESKVRAINIRAPEPEGAPPTSPAPAAAAPSTNTLAKDSGATREAGKSIDRTVAAARETAERRPEQQGEKTKAAAKPSAAVHKKAALDLREGSAAHVDFADDSLRMAPAAPPPRAAAAAAPTPAAAPPAPKEAEPPQQAVAQAERAERDAPGLAAAAPGAPARRDRSQPAPPPEPLGALGSSAGGAVGAGQAGGLNASESVGVSRGGGNGQEAANIAAQLESRARTLRLGGSYSEAATLYKQAASLHQRAAEGGAPPVPVTNQAPADGASQVRRDAQSQAAGPAKGLSGSDLKSGSAAALAAAWDLAHAIECLAADARIDEARAVYDDLLTSYPGATGPHSAAQRALRTALPRPAMKLEVPAVDQPRAAPAAPDPAVGK